MLCCPVSEHRSPANGKRRVTLVVSDTPTAEGAVASEACTLCALGRAALGGAALTSGECSARFRVAWGSPGLTKRLLQALLGSPRSRIEQRERRRRESSELAWRMNANSGRAIRIVVTRWVWPLSSRGSRAACGPSSSTRSDRADRRASATRLPPRGDRTSTSGRSGGRSAP